MKRQLVLIGGPYDGVIHELQGRVMPEKVALLGDNGSRHWYVIKPDGTAVYEEPR